ncbi:MAG: Na/Pi cotransporter family protein [Acidimicrobiia bacterium]
MSWILATATSVAEGSTDSVDWLTLIVGMAGGLALFLFGMDRMTESLRIVVGDGARNVIGRLTSNRFVGALTGAGITAVVQSSSVTTVLVVGFISAGLMTFIESVPIIIGSNVGTTITAQVIAFNVTTWALGFVAVGFLIAATARKQRSRAQGTALIGLGLIFLGMTVMGEAMSPLRTYVPFIELMATLDSLLVGIVVGAVFTAAVQSSSATTAVVIVLASQGLISLEAGIALILGANIGTSVTAMLAAIGKPLDAQRAAVAHLLFNVIGVLIWIPLIGLVADWVMSIGGGIEREIANAHTIFNVANALIFLPFVNQFAALVTKLLPDRPDQGLVSPRYIDDELLRAPSLALAKARMEMMRMASRVQTMLTEIMPAVIDGNPDELHGIEAMDDEVDALHGLILEFLGRVSQERLSEPSSAELVDLIEATNALEAVGDIIETNLIALGKQRIANQVTVSAETRELIEDYHKEVLDAFELSLVAVTQKDLNAAQKVGRMKKGVKQAEEEARLRYTERLTEDEPNRVATYRFEADVMANLKRIFYFTRRIARVAVPEPEQARLGENGEGSPDA